MRIVDTLKIKTRKRIINQTRINAESLRLFSPRNQYNLPYYKAHNTMQNTISTAELFSSPSGLYE
ncbi:hypothetical protein HUE58_01555 [Candidatus Ruthia endofausta]|uniref:Uncharacterized protein n=1 Tax=Candidatus Ruthia endofausta TaxID=2738852 RepID=A0A6N0HNK8_9GAMM|nr:hypothetical protein [Candidatus Ruthia endofausta]QKQ23890.1 hypothetical protein HUE58_01555 [Candidatus Ruthia endofausta]